MTFKISSLPAPVISCDNCEACCCRLEVLLLTDTGVPGHLIRINQWGEMTMARQDDGWCAALNRNTLMCMIYEKRPLVCREFEAGSNDCINEQAAQMRLKQSVNTHVKRAHSLP
jgi:Fe-S-cluster containining protein